MTDPAESELQRDPTISFWLKEALSSTANRDPLDAYNDVSRLLSICKGRLAKALEAGPKTDLKS